MGIYDAYVGMTLCGGRNNSVPFYEKRVTDEWGEKDGGKRVIDERRQKVDYIPCSTICLDIIICDY